MMRNINKQRGQLLIIYLTTLFIGGSSLALGVLATGQSIKQLEKNVKTHVLDPSKQQQSLALLKQWKDEGKAQKKEYKKQRKKLFSLIKKHDADKESFDLAINDILKMDQQNSKRLLDIQYKLRKNMTPNEWGKVMSGL